MKTPKNASVVRKITGLAIGLTVTILCFSSCDKSSLEYIAPPIDSITGTLQNKPNQIPMNFTLVLNNCFAGGAGVSVNIAMPQNYSYSWEVNGGPGGHQPNTSSCNCGGIAKVTVTRLADGLSRSKSINLPACNTVSNQEARLKNKLNNTPLNSTSAVHSSR